MAKHLRFNSLDPIEAPGLDGHKYKLRFDVGELINGTFKSVKSYEMPVMVSGLFKRSGNNPIHRSPRPPRQLRLTSSPMLPALGA
jgi:hypothetical protein